MKDYVSHHHPSYGLLQISRVSGGERPLFGSPIRHSQAIRLRVCSAHLDRDEDLHNDWYREDDQIIEVEMSLSQFAEAITSLNQGVGTPCTIRYRDSKDVERCGFVDKREEIEKEFEKERNKLAGKLTSGIGSVADILKKKSINNTDKQTITNTLESVRDFLTSHMPFLASQFTECMDKITTAAKGEILAFAQNNEHVVALAMAAKQEKALLEEKGDGDAVPPCDTKTT